MIDLNTTMDQDMASLHEYLQTNKEQVDSYCDEFSKFAAVLLCPPLQYFGGWQLFVQLTLLEVEIVLDLLSMFALLLFGPEGSKMTRGLMRNSLCARNCSIRQFSQFAFHAFSLYDFKRKIPLVTKGILALFCYFYRFFNGTSVRSGHTNM